MNIIPFSALDVWCSKSVNGISREEVIRYLFGLLLHSPFNNQYITPSMYDQFRTLAITTTI